MNRRLRLLTKAFCCQYRSVLGQYWNKSQRALVSGASDSAAAAPAVPSADHLYICTVILYAQGLVVEGPLVNSLIVPLNSKFIWKFSVCINEIIIKRKLHWQPLCIWYKNKSGKVVNVHVPLYFWSHHRFAFQLLLFIQSRSRWVTKNLILFISEPVYCLKLIKIFSTTNLKCWWKFNYWGGGEDTSLPLVKQRRCF